jgi:hypothetical protein
MAAFWQRARVVQGFPPCGWLRQPLSTPLVPPALGAASFGTVQPKAKEHDMGLDMYAMVLNKAPETPVDFNTEGATELHYWRKHPNLHGWMQKLYIQRGGAASSFNCVPVQLDSEDLDRLEADIKAKKLPYTDGFFFGETDGTEMEDDLAFIAKAREAIAEGLTVFYDSWW